MAIHAAKVKKVCSTSEAALVRASRKGQLETLTHAQLKQSALRTRKLLDKWRDLKRGQARGRSREEGEGTADANTKLKYQIFREALASFEAQIATVESGTREAVKQLARTTKKQRNVEHRATRAAMRKGMTAALDLENASRAASSAERKPKPAKSASGKPASPKPATKSGAAASVKKSKAVSQRSAAKAMPLSVGTPKSVEMNRGLQMQAAAAAKQRRIARSGKTTRLRSHTKAQGKRAQARRDRKP